MILNIKYKFIYSLLYINLMNFFTNIGKAVKRGLGTLFDLDTGVVSRALGLANVAEAVSPIDASGKFSFSKLASVAEKLPQTLAPVAEKAIGLGSNALEKLASSPLGKLGAVARAAEVAKGGLEIVKSGAEAIRNPEAAAREVVWMAM
jgi:hypothetical protein